jgi:hypothetical protein
MRYNGLDRSGLENNLPIYDSPTFRKLVTYFLFLTRASSRWSRPLIHHRIDSVQVLEILRTNAVPARTALEPRRTNNERFKSNISM